MAKNETAAVGTGVTTEQVQAMIAEALKGLVKEEQVKVLVVDELKGGLKDVLNKEQVVLIVDDRISAFKTILSGFITSAQAREIAVEEIHNSFSDGAVLHPITATLSGFEPDEKPPLDPDLLEGLTFRGSKPKTVKKDGVDKTVYQQFERELTVDDVLGYTDNGDHVVITAKDGRKHRIEK